ncbi:MAG TPA: DNA-3-methyladenine glycosylase [Bacteroidales bacterium]|nr:DNA-3-methyladenine glycosylase [Bacteroidales bacterium]HPT01154.1 DNA-3-methyladenine glycosylase [Bacteroidales bacterium]
MILPRDFYTREDVVGIARELLGKKLCTTIGGETAYALISETEAYEGVTDKASHAYGGRRTARTEIMYRQGGTAYVYLCYGIHSLFNIVTNQSGIPHAVLIRGIIPEDNNLALEKRSGMQISEKAGTGPGNVSRLLRIHYRHTGLDLCIPEYQREDGDVIWLEDAGIVIPDKDIIVTTRVGIDYAGEDALLPYRFIWKRR